ncbi:hypothetical protein K493DRAFT_348562 [Basidiobolus meristosporus CBS 931.73]|uniref:Uncharacterized protein n=1 Tax=Basidiobolus meristosporus CBS 931.73 TaxID=1314790 RepID=A0A1Y1YN60_9FUNG|nr:hypothetical protein K493DRAFT_348562 [Basidiobolus meristosporus CBS 931.73]|eukprot:ORX99442.1 hypothetical protein K493DRAFT_348562 [Basidiobolus meristosporus CBS 931.73]
MNSDRNLEVPAMIKPISEPRMKKSKAGLWHLFTRFGKVRSEGSDKVVQRVNLRTSRSLESMLKEYRNFASEDLFGRRQPWHYKDRPISGNSEDSSQNKSEDELESMVDDDSETASMWRIDSPYSRPGTPDPHEFQDPLVRRRMRQYATDQRKFDEMLKLGFAGDQEDERELTIRITLTPRSALRTQSN